MFNCLIRTAMIYVMIVLVMRILGKRQIGDLQPGELVITILLSDIFSIPLQEPGLPFYYMFIPVSLLVGLELIISFISLKSGKVRRVMQGNFVAVIENGVLLQENLKALRFSVDDLIEELRKKDVFDISLVEYAVVETDGSLSVLLKQDGIPPKTVISDGKIISEQLSSVNLSEDALKNTLEKNGILPQDVFLMTADRDGNFNIIKKEEEK